MEDPHAQRAAPLPRMFLDVGIDFARRGQGARELGEGWLFPSRDVAEKSSEGTGIIPSYNGRGWPIALCSFGFREGKRGFGTAETAEIYGHQPSLLR